MIKKVLFVFILLGILFLMCFGCVPTTPTEGEPESVDRIVLMEIYMAIGCSHCEEAKPILEQLVEDYGNDQLILVEEAPWGDYTTSEISNRYEWYFPNDYDRGIPNILFNGLNDNRIQGYSSSNPDNPQAFKAEAENAIDTELSKGSKILINALKSLDNGVLTITGNIENKSNSTLNNIEISGMLFKERSSAGLKYSVTDIFNEQKVEIATLLPGAVSSYTFTLTGINLEIEDNHGVIFVQESNGSDQEILQAYYLEL